MRSEDSAPGIESLSYRSIAMTFEAQIRALCAAAGWTEIEVVDETLVEIPFEYEDDAVAILAEQLEDGRGKHILALATSYLPWPDFDDEAEAVDFFQETLHFLLQRNGHLQWGFWGIDEDEDGEEQFALFCNLPLNTVDEDLFEHVVTEIFAEFTMVIDELYE